MYDLEDDVVDIFMGAPDITIAKQIYPVFYKENEKHLSEEERILMPAIGKMMKQGIPIKKYIESDILPVLLENEGDMEFFIKFANEILQKHDTEPDKPRVRVFDHALWALASKEQWNEWDAWIKETLTEDKYEELQMAIEDYVDERKAKKAAAKEAASSPSPVKDVVPEQPASSRMGFFKRLLPNKLPTTTN